MTLSTTTRRIIATALLAVPFGLAVPVLASASTSESDSHAETAGEQCYHDEADGDDADGGGADGGGETRNPQTNTSWNNNPGEAFQAGDLVAAALQVSPAANVGGIANSGDVDQSNEQDQDVNSGIIQSGRGGGNGGTAVQGGDLIGITGQVSPAVNVGGILNSGDVDQSNEQDQDVNSGISQGGGSRGGSHGGGPTAVQGGSLLGIDLQIAPAINIGGILSSGDVNQSNSQNQGLLSGIQQR